MRLQIRKLPGLFNRCTLNGCPMTNEIDVSKVIDSEENAQALSMKIEKLLDETSSVAVNKAIDRLLENKLYQKGLINPEVYEKFYKLNPEIADRIMAKNIEHMSEENAIALEAMRKNQTNQETIISTSIDRANQRNRIFSQKSTIFAFFGVPLLVFVILVIYDKPFVASFMLLLTYSVGLGLIFADKAVFVNAISSIKSIIK